MKFEEYMESKEYEKDLSKRIIKKYSPISEKILVLNNLFNASLKKDAYVSIVWISLLAMMSWNWNLQWTTF